MAQHSLPVLPFHTFPQPQLSPCCHESAESRWGAGDAISCTQPAVIHDVATEQDYCFAHYKAVSRG
jgi:hypothetical protein